MDIYEQLNQIPGNVIEDYLSSAANMAQSPDDYSFKKIFGENGNRLAREIRNRLIEISARNLEGYLLEKAITYRTKFESLQLTSITKEGLGALIEATLRNEFKLEIPQSKHQPV